MSYLILFVNIDAVSEIFTFKFIRPLSALELSINDRFIVVESDLNFVVMTIESVKIAARKTRALSTNDRLIVVESDLSFVVIAVESNKIFALKPDTLSPNAVPVEADNLLILYDKDAVSRAKRDVSIAAVSAIFTFKLILPFNALALSTNDPLIVVESDLNLVVMTVESVKIAARKTRALSINDRFIVVESDLNFVVMTVESVKIAARKTRALSTNDRFIVVESDLSFVVIAVESVLIFVAKIKESLYTLLLKALELSARAVPEADPVVNALILFDKVIVSTFCNKNEVSLLILLVNISAVSEILSLRLILPLSALELSTKDLLIVVESDLILAAKTTESLYILLLIALVLSESEVPDDVFNNVILLDKLAVSRANLKESMLEVSAF